MCIEYVRAEEWMVMEASWKQFELRCDAATYVRRRIVAQPVPPLVVHNALQPQYGWYNKMVAVERRRAVCQ